MNAGTCWEQEYNRPNGLSAEKAPKSDLYLLPLTVGRLQATCLKVLMGAIYFYVFFNELPALLEDVSVHTTIMMSHLSFLQVR